MQIYIDKEIPIRVAGSQSAGWGTYNPGLYLGDYDVNIKLGASAETIKEASRQQAMQFYLLASKLPFIDQQKLFATIATVMFEKTKKEITDLISPPPATPPPTVVPKLIESIKFEQLYPDEQGELLAESGIAPSPLRQQATGIQASPVDPNKVARNASIIHNPNPTSGGVTDYSNAGQVAGTGTPQAVGAANIQGSPNA